MLAWQDTTLPTHDRVEALLAHLTLEQKVGQLGSVWPVEADKVTVAGSSKPRDVAPEMAEMFAMTSSGAELEEGLGHVTRVFGRQPQTAADGVQALREWQRKAMEVSGNDIPAIIHEESLTGFCTYGATVYPAAIAWGATFDPGLVAEMAAAIGEDMRAVGVDQALSPLLDVVRDYRWGRVEETCGEDPYVVGTLGTAYVKGLQGAGVYATLKHYAGYSASKAGRNHAPVEMGRRQFEDVILPPFEMAVREGKTESVMNSYSDVDGVPAVASSYLLTEVLRDRWGFEGTVVSDYFAAINLKEHHRVAATLAEAGRLSLAAGLDIELPFTAAFFGLVDEVRSGRLSEELIDRAVRRVLRQKVLLGLLDPDYTPETVGDPGRDLDSPHNRDIARRMAEQSIVLCSNDGVLPLASGTKVALVGPTCDEPLSFMGCYAYPNHVLRAYSEPGYGIDIRGLKEALGAEYRLTHAVGVPIRDLDTSGIADAVAACAGVDAVVLAVGDVSGLFGEGTTGEGCDADDLRLPGVQDQLVEAVLATGKPVVLLVLSGRPYALGAYVDRCAAIVQAFFPGAEAADAVAGVLTGRVNPTGKLPVGVPRTVGGQPGTYLGSRLALELGVSSLDARALFAFGHGLSYTSFEVSDLVLDAAEVPVDGVLEASVTVTNTGARAGAEVVQVYLTDLAATVVQPVKRLVGYVKVWLSAEESKRVTFTLHADRMSFTGIDYARIVEPGAMVLRVGTSSTDLPLEGAFALTGATRVVGEGRVLVTPVAVTGV
jgi:beta-xylosidase